MTGSKHNIFFYIILFFILFICLKIYSESDVFNLKCIVSGVDGNKYCVREREKINEEGVNNRINWYEPYQDLIENLFQQLKNKNKNIIPANLEINDLKIDKKFMVSLDRYSFHKGSNEFMKDLSESIDFSSFKESPAHN